MSIRVAMQFITLGLICILVVGVLHKVTSAERRAPALDYPSCLDEEGRQVDWYIAYKFPKVAEEREPLNSGYAYAYMTSQSVTEPAEDRQWVLSSKLISDPDSIVMRTLAIAYGEKSPKVNSIFYNDQHPDERGNSSSRMSTAHAKGVVLMDDTTGSSIWLTHSTPSFPPVKTRPLEFFDESRKYGETFMCIRFDLRKTGLPIVNHLINMQPRVYLMEISKKLLSILPELRGLKDEPMGVSSKKTDKLAQQIETIGGQELRLYSKSPDFADDLYSGWLASEPKTNLYVKTFRNETELPLKSNKQVKNVKYLRVNNHGWRVVWSNLLDHSKWAISEDEQSAIVCISDIDRLQAQFKRGGGAVCMECRGCWSVFSNTIHELEPYP